MQQLIESPHLDKIPDFTEIKDSPNDKQKSELPPKIHSDIIDNNVLVVLS
jgi:hypothetical protein